MDVRCSRCGTEYEFDDALISERGTTVKCTNCGCQFKVYPDAGAAAPERWVVRTAAGRELVYTSLKDLQRGIAKEHVSADDMLSRGNSPARTLSSIPELEPFLQANARAVAGTRAPRTLQGVAPAANPSGGGDGPASLVLREDASSPNHDRPLGTAPAIGQALGASRSASLPENLRAPSSATTTTNPGGFAPLSALSTRTPRGGVGLGSVPPVQVAPSLPTSESLAPPTSARYAPQHDPRQNGAAVATATTVAERFVAAPAPAPDSGVGNASGLDTERGAAAEPHARGLDEARALLQHDDQTDPYYVAPTRRNVRSRWLVLVVVLAAGVLLAGTVGKRYFAKYTKGKDPTATQADARVTTLLAEGERLMVRGDLDGANDAFDKASALAQNDRQVLTALATLEVVRADLLWLEERVIDPNDAGARERTRRGLAERVERAQHAVDRVKRVAPEPASTERLLVHAKRLNGKVRDARSHVATLSKDAALPENAYALAALDMADQAPVWSSIVHRMRIAAAAEGPLGLARAGLVYALARSGEAEAAQAELEQLSKANPSHPLVFDLREFLKRTHADSDTSLTAAAGSATATGTSAPGEAADGDFRAQLKQAYEAVERGELAKGKRLYNAVLAKQPGNTEAISGLADIAQRSNDTKEASRLNAEVLSKNPSYLPALMASADLRWDAGDRHSAVQLYQRILEQAGKDSSYGQRSAQRIAQAQSDAKAEHDPDSVTERPAPEAPAPEESTPNTPAQDTPAREPEASDAPHIDTTDLPEHNQ